MKTIPAGYMTLGQLLERLREIAGIDIDTASIIEAGVTFSHVKKGRVQGSLEEELSALPTMSAEDAMASFAVDDPLLEDHGLEENPLHEIFARIVGPDLTTGSISAEQAADRFAFSRKCSERDFGLGRWIGRHLAAGRAFAYVEQSEYAPVRAIPGEVWGDVELSGSCLETGLYPPNEDGATILLKQDDQAGIVESFAEICRFSDLEFFTFWQLSETWSRELGNSRTQGEIYQMLWSAIWAGVFGISLFKFLIPECRHERQPMDYEEEIETKDIDGEAYYKTYDRHDLARAFEPAIREILELDPKDELLLDHCDRIKPEGLVSLQAPSWHHGAIGVNRGEFITLWKETSMALPPSMQEIDTGEHALEAPLNPADTDVTREQPADEPNVYKAKRKGQRKSLGAPRLKREKAKAAILVLYKEGRGQVAWKDCLEALTQHAGITITKETAIRAFDELKLPR